MAKVEVDLNAIPEGKNVSHDPPAPHSWPLVLNPFSGRSSLSGEGSPSSSGTEPKTKSIRPTRSTLPPSATRSRTTTASRSPSGWSCWVRRNPPLPPPPLPNAHRRCRGTMDERARPCANAPRKVSARISAASPSARPATTAAGSAPATAPTTTSRGGYERDPRHSTSRSPSTTFRRMASWSSAEWCVLVYEYSRGAVVIQGATRRIDCPRERRLRRTASRASSWRDRPLYSSPFY